MEDLNEIFELDRLLSTIQPETKRRTQKLPASGAISSGSGAIVLKPAPKPVALKPVTPASEKYTIKISEPQKKKAGTLDCIIVRSGMFIDYDNLANFVDINTLIKSLNVSYTFRIGNLSQTKIIPLFRVLHPKGKRKILNVARFSGIKTILSGINPHLRIQHINNITPGLSIADKWNTTESETGSLMDLEDYQNLCLDYLMNNFYTKSRFQSGNASCTFVMDTGLGKTFVAAGLIERLKVKTLVIIPNSSNLSGWEAPFKLYLQNLQVGGYYTTAAGASSSGASGSGNKVKRDGDVVIMIVNSALKQTFKFGNKTYQYWEYFKQFGLVIIDEIHDFPTATRHEIFWRTGAPAMLGLTATPDERLDQMDVVYYKHIGPLVRAKNIPGFADYIEETKFTGSIRLIKYYGPPEFTINKMSVLDCVSAPEMHKQFAADPWRNQLVFNLIIECYEAGRNIFVFGEHRSFLDELFEKVRNWIIEKNKTTPINVSTELTTFMGGFDAADMEAAYKTARIIFTTLRFGKQSISIARMDTIILAQPLRNKMRQLIGRMLRRGGDTSIPRLMIDIQDMNTSIKSQYQTRKQIYKEKGFAIHPEKIYHSDIYLTESLAPLATQ